MPRSRSSAVALSILLVVASIASVVAVQPAAAESFERTVDGSPKFAVVDQSTIEGEYTVEFATSDAPGETQNETVLYRETHNANNVNDTKAFANDGAYEDITIRVSGVSEEPDMGSGSEFGSVNWRKGRQYAETGGDRGFKCNVGERMVQTVNPAANVIDCGPLPGATEVDDADAEETKLEIYQSAKTQSQFAENAHTGLENRFNDAEEVALMKGKGAFAWSAAEGESESSAQANATAAVADHYAHIERNQLADWTTHIENIAYLKETASNESGVDSNYVEIPWQTDSDYGSAIESVEIVGTEPVDYTLVNGTDVSISGLKIQGSTGSDTYSKTIGPSLGEFGWSVDSGTVYTDDIQLNNEMVVAIKRVKVNPPNDNYNASNPLHFEDYEDHFSTLSSQHSSASGNIGDVVSGLHDGVVNGDLNVSDIVDPYTLSNQFSAGSEYGGWAAATLASVGVNQPKNFSSAGTTNITLESGETLSGVLMSQSNPESGQFGVDETYNPAAIGGSQWLVADGEMHELSENFTLDRATTVNGENQSQITIEEKTYDTTSAENLSTFYSEMNELRAEIEARENAMVGGGGPLDDLGGTEKLVGGAAIALVAYGAVRD